MVVAWRPLPVALRFWIAGRFPRPLGTDFRLIFLDFLAYNSILGGLGGILGPTVAIFLKLLELISDRFFASVVPKNAKT